MRKLGLIGGMSWVSTRTYYEHINRIVQARTDRRSSAPPKSWSPRPAGSRPPEQAR